MKLWQRRVKISEPRLIEAAETLARTFEHSEDEQVASLRNRGFGESEAHRLVALLPIAFSRPVLEELGVRTFVSEVSATGADGTVVRANLMRQPEYVAGLRLARKQRRTRVMDQLAYERILGSSADIDAASNALNNGADIRGGTIASSLVGPEIARHLIR